jgi:hypothetical protein
MKAESATYVLCDFSGATTSQNLARILPPPVPKFATPKPSQIRNLLAEEPLAHPDQTLAQTLAAVEPLDLFWHETYG